MSAVVDRFPTKARVSAGRRVLTVEESDTHPAYGWSIFEGRRWLRAVRDMEDGITVARTLLASVPIVSDPLELRPTATRPERRRKAGPTAKGCHGCRFAFGLTCSAAFASSVQTWQAQHLQPDLMTPKPNAPECPGRVSNSGN